MLQRCVALKIVLSSRIVKHHLNAGNLSPRGKTNMHEKAAAGLPDLRKVFNVIKFRMAYIYLRDHYFKQQREDLLVIKEKYCKPKEI